MVSANIIAVWENILLTWFKKASKDLLQKTKGFQYYNKSLVIRSVLQII